MASERGIELARTILDDLRGAGYYADPKVLADYLRSSSGRGGQPIGEADAIGLIRNLLRRYGMAHTDVQEELAEELDSMLLRDRDLRPSATPG
jgi:hypothetical protein